MSELSKTQPKIIGLNSPKGRAKQMNFGASQSKGSVLYFLHADSIPPKHFDQYIVDAMDKGSKTGCFKMKFDNSHWWLQLAGWFTQFNWKSCRGGDQSLFIEKIAFEAIGGFNEDFVIYEDNDLLVINKPAGIIMHPGAGNYDGSNALAFGFVYVKENYVINVGHAKSDTGGKTMTNIGFTYNISSWFQK